MEVHDTRERRRASRRLHGRGVWAKTLCALIVGLTMFPLGAAERHSPSQTEISRHPTNRVAPFEAATVTNACVGGTAVGVHTSFGAAGVEVAPCTPQAAANPATGAVWLDMQSIPPMPSDRAPPRNEVRIEFFATFNTTRPLEHLTIRYEFYIARAEATVYSSSAFDGIDFYLDPSVWADACTCGDWRNFRLFTARAGYEPVVIPDTTYAIMLHLNNGENPIPPGPIRMTFEVAAYVSAVRDDPTTSDVEQARLSLEGSFARIVATPFEAGWDRNPPARQAKANREVTMVLAPPFEDDDFVPNPVCDADDCKARKEVDLATGAFRLRAYSKDAVVLNSESRVDARWRTPLIDLPAHTALRLDVHVRLDMATAFTRNLENTTALAVGLISVHGYVGSSVPLMSAFVPLVDASKCASCAPGARTAEEVTVSLFHSNPEGTTTPPSQINLAFKITAWSAVRNKHVPGIGTVGVGFGEALAEMDGQVVGVRLTVVP
jgi:hypothetical protein